MSYLGLASLRFAGRGGLTLGVGGGSLVGNVARLASTAETIGKARHALHHHDQNGALDVLCTL